MECKVKTEEEVHVDKKTARASVSVLSCMEEEEGDKCQEKEEKEWRLVLRKGERDK
jgi:hypothetical protein